MARGLMVLGALAGTAASGLAEVPSYSVEVIAPYTVTTTLRGASESGHLVGDQIVAGFSTAFVATAAEGIVHLPLPMGYSSSIAFGVNDAGVVVGTASTSGFAFDLGEPAIWEPDGAGGYTVTIPQQFATLPDPLRPPGTIGVQGGQAIGVNEDGVVVGWTRYSGFSGGPATLFRVDGAPENLQQTMGFSALVRGLSDTGLVCGDGRVLELSTHEVTELGLPPDEPGYLPIVSVIAYVVNDSGQVVAAARQATAGNEVWVSFVRFPDGTWRRHNPAVPGSRFVSFYDNNDLGDVVAGGGVRFMPEDELFGSFDALLEPGAQHWDVSLGFILDDRRVATTGYDATSDQLALVLLHPSVPPCPADLAQPAGTLDFFDVLEFLARFDAFDPSSDLAAPYGVYDFFDVLEYLAQFDAGCE